MQALRALTGDNDAIVVEMLREPAIDMLQNPHIAQLSCATLTTVSEASTKTASDYRRCMVNSNVRGNESTANL